MAIRLKTFGGEHPSVARSYNNIGEICQNKVDIKRALEYFEKSLELGIRMYDKKHPDVLKMLDIDDTNYFEEFIFYHKRLDSIRQESLKDVNLELAEYIENYKSEKAVTSDQVRKFYPIIDLGSSNG